MKHLFLLYQKRVNIDGDAGVDLYFLMKLLYRKIIRVKVDLKIQAEMVQEVNNQLTQNIPKEMLSGMFDISDKYLSYIVSPRSSIIKTPLRMSNSIGSNGLRLSWKLYCAYR